VLGVDRVGVGDNFFALGGDSIMSIKVASRLRERGLVITPKLLFQHQTIAELVAAARHAIPAEQGPVTGLIPLNQSAAAPMIFCPPDGGGSVRNYTRLAGLLSPHARVFGFDESAAAAAGGSGLGVPQFAAAYAGVMRERQPHGPYFLVGWSFGGICSFEIARLLLDAGEEVAPLHILDAPAGVQEYGLARERAELTQRAIDELIRSRAHATPAPELLAAMAAIELAEDVASLGYDELLGLMQRMLRSVSALTAYRPEPLGHDIVLYEAEGSQRPFNLSDTWKPVVRDLDHRLIPGGHGAPLSEPHVRAVARSIAETVSAHSAPDGVGER
jgi:thioesterase domain-containing protein